MKPLRKLLAGCVLLTLTSPAFATVYTFQALMNGANEVLPNVGDPDGFGDAIVTIDDSNNQVTWAINVFNIAGVSADHIHQAPAGVNGSVVVNFSGMLNGTTTTTPALASAIIANPAGFYVNVHNSAHPGGAIRGQLALIPEPGSVGLLALGLGGLLLRRRVR